MITYLRQSGMTDADWCRENDIAVSTFYNWVRGPLQNREIYGAAAPFFMP